MGEFLASNFQAFVHRGNAKSFRENTIEAFQSAKEIGFNYLETDLRITKDDKIITFHDPDLLRTCLLYTSPSPRDRQKCRMPSYA